MVEAIKRDARTCPDPETIAAFLDGKLSGRERTQVVEHLADCADCYFIFSESARMSAAADATTETATAGWRRWIAQPMVLWPPVAALAAAAALAVAVGTGVVPWRSSSQPELQALVAAVGTDRTVEPRLTGGFAYGPVKTPRGTATDASPGVRIAAAEIEKAALANRTPATLRALGISYLVTGDVARAVTVLEEAADRPSPDAQVLSDLGAAYLVRAARSNQPQDLAKALTFADRAVKANPRLAEAWFNRAIALERLSLTTEARGAWRDYLRVDPRSEWASDARLHLQPLESESR